MSLHQRLTPTKKESQHYYRRYSNSNTNNGTNTNASAFLSSSTNCMNSISNSSISSGISDDVHTHNIKGHQRYRRRLFPVKSISSRVISSRPRSLFRTLFTIAIVLAIWWLFYFFQIQKIQREEWESEFYKDDWKSKLDSDTRTTGNPLDKSFYKKTSKSTGKDNQNQGKPITNTNTNTEGDNNAPILESTHSRPLTLTGERKILELIQSAMQDHMITQKEYDAKIRQSRGIRGFFENIFPPEPSIILTKKENSNLNQTIMDIVVKHPKKVKVNKKFNLKKTELSEAETKAIQEGIERVNRYHSAQGKFDTCRGVYWNEIEVDIPGICSVNRTNVGITDEEQIMRGINVKNQKGIKTQMHKIVENISPYIPQMEAEGMTYRTVLIIPNALCLGTNFNPNPQTENNMGDSKSKFAITLTTHMGVGKYQRFLVLLQRWNGPISIAVKIRNLDEIHLFHSFILQHLDILDNVLFHYYVEHAPEYDQVYPQNILRNLAMTHIGTEYFLVNDVDIFPSPVNTHDRLRDLIAADLDIQKGLLSEDKLYIIPMFDFNKVIPDDELTYDHAEFPKTKQDATFMNGTGVISQHLMAQHPKGHRAVDYEKWFGNKTGPSYGIEFENKFEPYAIGSRTVLKSITIAGTRRRTTTKQMRDLPLFYPHYRGYGFDKYSWYAELTWSGYKLEVLRDFFLFHAKHDSSYGDNDNKKALLKINRVCAKDFLRDIIRKYGPQDNNSVWNDWIKEIYK